MQVFIRAKISWDPFKRDLNSNFDNNVNDLSFENDA